jgi:UMF1 family MFS transporter
MVDEKLEKRSVLSWAMYDWANSAFATIVLAAFFPVFFRGFWSADQASESITMRLGLANSIASLVIVALGPILGAVADSGGMKKRFLFAFLSMGVGATGALYWVAKGQWAAAMVLFILSTIGFMGANVFYDALLVCVTSRDRYDFVSAFGFSLGYLGGGLLLAVCVAMTLRPASFGLASDVEAVRLSFLFTGVWWAVFSIPLFLFVKEPGADEGPGLLAAARGGFAQLAETFREIRQLKQVFLFLLAYWLYIDGVDTIIRMAVDYGMALGFGTNGLIIALLITQFVGFPAAIVYGKLGQRYGAKYGIVFGIVVYVLVTVWAFFMSEAWEFYALAVTIGLVQGGVQALSRSLFASIIPADKSAEFFGFYNMLGKFAAVIGPVLVGWVGVMTGNPRAGILSLLILFTAGGAILLRVKPNEQ